MRLGIMGAIASALAAVIPMWNGRNPVRWYKKSGIGTVSRIPRDHAYHIAVAEDKRDRRNRVRLNTWTGVRA